MKNRKFNTQAEDIIEVTIDEENKEETTMNEKVEAMREAANEQVTEEPAVKIEKKHKIRNAVENGAVKFIGFTQKHPVFVTATTALVSGAVSAFVAYKFGVHVGEEGFLGKWAADLAKDVKDSGVKDIVGMTKDGVMVDLHDICDSEKAYDAAIAAAQILNPAEGVGVHIGRIDDVIEVTSTLFEKVADVAPDVEDTTEAVQEILDSVTEL